MAVGEELSARKKQILKAVIDAHIESGEPIGSKYIAANTDLGLSSATIRNELAELEEQGYLEHPHTSAGRVPTSLGYRFYVDELMNAYSLTARELNVLGNLQQVRIAELDRILRSASKITAAITNYTGVAVKHIPVKPIISTFKTGYVDKNSFIISFIMNDNTVKTKFISVPFEINDGVLNTLCGVLNNNIANRTPDMITLPLIMKMQQEMGQYDEIIPPIMKCINEVAGDQGDGDIHIDGMDHLLEYPEYADTSALRELFSLFDRKDDFVELIEKAPKDAVSVYIGGEEDSSIVNNSSLIVRPLRKKGAVVGAIGVIGPTRMEYSKAVAIIDYMAKAINTLLDGDTKALSEGVFGTTQEGETRNE